jgi:hypothetical protein
MLGRKNIIISSSKVEEILQTTGPEYSIRKEVKANRSQKSTKP